MNVTNTFNINFKGNIIDSHVHVGTFNGNVYTKDNLDIFVKSNLPNKDNVEKMIVSDLDVLCGLNNEFDGNKTVLNIFKNDKKYALLASCNPQKGNISDIEKLFKKYPNKFVGLKFHSSIQNLNLTSEKYKPYLDFASQNNLPCLFHSQVALLKDGKINPNKKHIADPESIYNLAKKYSKLPFVMAHLGAGWNEAHDKAIDVLIEAIKNNDANLYADISWVDIDNPTIHIIKAIKRLKGIGDKDWRYGDQSYRLMFGTDAPLERFGEEGALKTYSDFVDKIKTSIRNDKDLSKDAEKIIDDLFYNNAKKLYLSQAQVVQKKKGNILSKKNILIFAMLIAVCGITVAVLQAQNYFKMHTS